MRLPGSVSRPLEMWAGIECTVNRVGDAFFDQMARSGHAHRTDDLDRFASLGIRTLRYPLLWERTVTSDPNRYDWSWADERLPRMRDLGIRPILGLVHHGSGPRGTSLLDPRFPARLARFAGAVAERYPWIDLYTPINEPLTTARFSGLYGLWYPHGRTSRIFLRILYHECRAVATAMRAVRAVNPAAQLVQTEDLGKIYSTPGLRYQAEFENERRWLAFDMLAGLVDHRHALWQYLRRGGLGEGELAALRDDPCVPDIMGANHYLTSERFLDERMERYPPSTHGGNGRHRYADVEAVRVCGEGIAGPQRLLREAWDRYELPLVVTEVHLSCTREQQLRWLHEVWHAARALRTEGVDVRAVTAWSLLGAYDWGCLLARDEGRYEPGVFDVRAPTPRPTAIATAVRSLATTGEWSHPALDGPGWWRRPLRLAHPPVGVRIARSAPPPTSARSQPVAIVGAAGTLGTAFGHVCHERGLAHCSLDRQAVDIADAEQVGAMLDEIRPWVVVNAAGYVRVDDAEDDRDACDRANISGAKMLAEACAARGIALATFSSDLVFDGRKSAPYVESDPVAPLSVYGASKATAEQRVAAAHPGALIVRTSAFFGPWDDYNFVVAVLRTLEGGMPFDAAADAVVSPTYVPDLAHATLDLAIDGERGIWHLASQGAVTWAELAWRVALQAGLDANLVRPRSTASLGLRAARPLQSALASERAWIMPPLEDALERFFHHRPNRHRQPESETPCLQLQVGD